jgi:hypothetical protein
MKKLRSGIIIGMLACLSMLMFIPATASAATTPKAVSVHHALTTPVSGTLSNGKVFAGTFTITRFVSQNKKLFAVGTITGTLKNAASSGVASAASPQLTLPVAIPVIAAAASCSVLALTLGPLDLNLLGLTVHLNQVVLNINAIPGDGLLGSLLCSVAGLLNGGGLLSSLTGLLNQILAAL